MDRKLKQTAQVCVCILEIQNETGAGFMPCYSFNLKMVRSSKEHFLRRGERGRFLVALGDIQGTGLLSLFTQVCYRV